MANAYQAGFDAIDSFKFKEFLAYNYANWSLVDRFNWLATYTAAQSGADPDAEAWVTANRRFVVNNDAVNHDLDLNGETFTFNAGAIYACSFDEAAWFLNQASIKGFNITEDTAANWIAGGVVTTFFE